MAAGGRRVCLGVVTGAHGVKGWVRIKPFTETPEGLTAYGPLSDKAGERWFDIVEARPARDMILARIAGVDGREAAEALRRTQLYVDRDALPEPEDEAWYHADLIGLEAVDVSGAALGRVTAVFNFGAGDLLEIRAGDGSSELVPFTRENVPQVDIGNGRLVVVPVAEGSEAQDEGGAP